MSQLMAMQIAQRAVATLGARRLVATFGAPAQSTAAPFASRRINDLVAELELPFDPAIIEWRVTNTTKNGKPRG